MIKFAKRILINNGNHKIWSKNKHFNIASEHREGKDLEAAMAKVYVPIKQLNDGHSIPILGLGTYGTSKDTARLQQTIEWAVKAGYRHFDTAALYKNEGQIGLGIKDVIRQGLVKREDLFITTKLDRDSQRRDEVVPALQASLKRLNLTYVDLYLIHTPPTSVDILETWKGMKDAKKRGLTKSIGVSNFNAIELNRILRNSTVKPAVNQIEVHPAHTRESLVSFCQKQNIAVVAYSPLGYLVGRNKADAPPPRMDDPTLLTLSIKYGKTPTQIVLRYLLDRDLIPIPKSTNELHLRQNIDVFNFNLTPEEVDSINNFNRNRALYGWQ